MKLSRLVVVGMLGGVVAYSGCVSGDDSNGQPDATTDASGSDVASQDSATQDVNTGDGATGCAARTASDTTGVFVASSGTDTSSCGTRANPCQTISYALSTAKSTAGKTTLYLSKATYAESITLDAALTLEGGWNDSGGTWTPVCDATTSTAVTIQGVTNTTVTAAFSGAGTLRDLQVTSKASAATGESIYGVFATGSATNLTLDTVVINVGVGGVGTNGVDGVTGAGATNVGCTSSDGSNGSTGSSGGGASSGGLSATGFSTQNGGDAGTGNVGDNGTGGGTGACMNTCDTVGGTCQTQCTILTNQQECGSAGLAGCAGQGGGGGSFGTGGGASIAVFVWDAHVTVFGGSFASSNGGNGGQGGDGGAGGGGTNGEAGAAGGCAVLQQPQCGLNKCTSVLVSATTLNGGTAGGIGGTGGNGGQGGGGSGGDSYAIVTGGDGGVTLNNSPTLAHGDGGTGGAASGTNGVAADRFP